MTMDISILILTLNEESNITALIDMLRSRMKEMALSNEIVVIDGNSVDNTRAVAQQAGARVELQKEPGYGSAFRQGINVCS